MIEAHDVETSELLTRVHRKGRTPAHMGSALSKIHRSGYLAVLHLFHRRSSLIEVKRRPTPHINVC